MLETTFKQNASYSNFLPLYNYLTLLTWESYLAFFLSKHRLMIGIYSSVTCHCSESWVCSPLSLIKDWLDFYWFSFWKVSLRMLIILPCVLLLHKHGYLDSFFLQLWKRWFLFHVFGILFIPWSQKIHTSIQTICGIGYNFFCWKDW